MIFRWMGVAATIWLSSVDLAAAQAPSWQQRLAAAESANDLPGALSIVRQVTADQPQAVGAWIQLGRLARMTGDLPAARRAYDRALDLAPNQPRALLGAAVVEAQTGDLVKANAFIARAVAAGILPGQLDGVAELEPLRATDAYKASYALADQAANPCRHQPEYTQFDFWVGDWDVYANGQPVARNIITREMNGCIIHERYQTINGLIRGESINYFDPAERKWKQDWVSSAGNVIHLEGASPEAGVMRLVGTSVSPGSPVQRQRVTWTRQPDGGVTQSVSVSNDNGATWSQGFVGTYVRSSRPTPTVLPDDAYPVNRAVSSPPGQ